MLCEYNTFLETYRKLFPCESSINECFIYFTRYYGCGPLSGKLFVIAAVLNIWIMCFLQIFQPSQVIIYEMPMKPVEAEPPLDLLLCV